jgi:hypothetical protein
MQTWTKLAVAGLILAGLLAISGSMSFDNRAAASSQCHHIYTIQTVVANFEEFTTEGEIKFGLLKGKTKFTGDPTSLATINGLTSPPLNPTSAYTGDLVITTETGTLTTRGVGVFEGVPFGRGTQFDRVIAGTGQFDGAEGHLYFNFVADNTGGAFTSIVSGEICVK